MEKHKIAFFAEVLIRKFDGATRTMFQIIDRIPKDDFDYLFFCGVPPTKDLPHQVFHVPSLTIPFNKTYKMASMFRMGPRITRKLDAFRPDVIHISTPSPLGYFALKYAASRNIPVISIYHTHFISYIKYYTKGTPLVTQALEGAVTLHNKSFYDRCDLVYIPTREMIHLLDKKGFDPRPMKLWRRGINRELFNPTKRNQSYIQRITGNQLPTLLFVSRLVWEKNLRTLIEIYHGIAKRGNRYNLVIAGDGVAAEELKREMPGAIFLGQRTQAELSVLYASSDYFIFPSETETYGNVVAEAMASGLACICADGGGVKSFIRHGINGFLCNPRDASDYWRMLDILANHPSLYQRITEQAVGDVGGLSWDSLVAIYFDDLRMLSIKGKLPGNQRKSSREGLSLMSVV